MKRTFAVIIFAGMLIAVFLAVLHVMGPANVSISAKEKGRADAPLRTLAAPAPIEVPTAPTSSQAE